VFQNLDKIALMNFYGFIYKVGAEGWSLIKYLLFLFFLFVIQYVKLRQHWCGVCRS